MFYATRNTLTHTHTALALALSVSALSLCPSFDTRSALSDPHLGCADGCSIGFHPGFLQWCFHRFSAFVDVRLDAFPARPRAQNGLYFTLSSAAIAHRLSHGRCCGSFSRPASCMHALRPYHTHAQVEHKRPTPILPPMTHPLSADPLPLQQPRWCLGGHDTDRQVSITAAS